MANTSQRSYALSTFSFIAACVAWALVACAPLPPGDTWISLADTVSDRNGHPIAGATISILVNGKPLPHGSLAITNDQGHYSIREGPCPCEYTVSLKAEAAGYAPYTAHFNSKDAGKHATHNIQLLRP